MLNKKITRYQDDQEQKKFMQQTYEMKSFISIDRKKTILSFYTDHPDIPLLLKDIFQKKLRLMN